SLAGINIYLENGNLYAGAWASGINNTWLSSTVNANTWNNVILTFSDTGYTRLFINGIGVGGFYTGTSMPSHTNGAAIGGCNSATQYSDGTTTCSGEYFNGKIDDVRVYNVALSAQEIYFLANGYNNSQESISNTDLTINGAFNLSSGTFTAPSGTMTIGGDFTGGSGFSHNNGTVVFADNTQISNISGNTTFYNLTATTAGKELDFAAGSTQTVNGTLTLTGSSGNLLTLRSSSAGSTWTINANAISNFDYLDVKDSVAGGNAAPFDPGANSIDSGNNSGWSFNEPPVVTYVSATQSSNGDGKVSLTFTITDPDGDDTVQATVEYSLDGGTTWQTATISESTSEISATYGSPAVNNANAHQIGYGGGYISTSSGANTITAVWDAASDVSPTTDLSTVMLRVTPYDGTDTGSATASSNFDLDMVAPESLDNFQFVSTYSSFTELSWTPATDSNFNHYEIWYALLDSDAQNRTGGAVEWDNDDDATLATMSTSSASVLANLQNKYVYIFAVDDYGNYSTVEGVFIPKTSNKNSSSSSESSDDIEEKINEAIESIEVKPVNENNDNYVSGTDSGSGSHSATYTVSNNESVKIAWDFGVIGKYFVDLYYTSNGVDYIPIAQHIESTDREYIWRLNGLDADSVSVRIDLTDLDKLILTETAGQLAIAGDTDNYVQFGNMATGSGEYGHSPATGEVEEISEVGPGMFIKSPSYSTVYYVDENMQRRPFLNEQSYFTWADSWSELTTVTDATLPELTLGTPMLPKQGVVMVKIQSDNKVYAIEGE
ncbi:LamG domain-containing protein, partial [Candidatus Parcubacteria bacterium]